MEHLIPSLSRDTRASAAAEMAQSLPLLFALIFGSMELGNYFMTEHKVVKAVRDGARYAARQPFVDYVGCTPSADIVTATQNVTRTGQVAEGGTPRVSSWTDDSTIDVTATCDSTWAGADKGVYVTSADGTPIVTVTATVPYNSILGQLGLADTSLSLHAESQAAVTGI